MVSNQPIRYILIAAVLLLVLWWQWPNMVERTGPENSEEEGVNRPLVSAIQPIETAGAAAKRDAVALALQSPDLDAGGDAMSLKQLRNGFSEARQAIDDGRTQSAIRMLGELIEQHPRQVEPYINLASVYAADGQLAQARQTLMDGMQANKNYAMLFTNLQKVHGALAANAYQTALAESGESLADAVDSVELPIIDAVDESTRFGAANLATLQQLESYKRQLDTVNREFAQTSSELADTNTKLAETDAQLLAANNRNSDLQKRLQSSEAEVNANSADQELEAKLAVAEQRIASLQVEHKNELARLQQDYQQQLDNQSLVASQLASQEQERQAREQREAEANRLAAARAAERRQQAAVAQAARAKQERDQQAIALVKSWAEAWSAQQVGNYVSHYADGYTPPGSGISHAAWREQRRIRLTNKSFIQVAVDDFDVRQLDERISVTFSQHYRSNTMDDTIRKQLIFSANGGAISNAKIVGERVLR
ncbi:MAG: tetratricopeptide repeat protein [Pseudomonadota bacterium]